MNLTPNDLAVIGTVVIVVAFLAGWEDPRAWNWVKAQWSNTVGACFARRRERKALGRPAPGWRNFKTR